MPLLSVLLPVFNEEEYVGVLIARVLQARLPDGLGLEIVVVDDCSTDGTSAILSDLAAEHPETIRVFRHERNRGKGAAVRTALQHARGEFGIIQDADLEYDPAEYYKLLNPLLRRDADVVYGSRFASAGERRVLYFWHSFANRALTLLCNMVSDLNLTDMETCYKAFPLDLVRSIPLRSDRFGIEPELTIKLAQRRARIYEVPVTYRGRSYEEGKKIGLKDALQAIWIILFYAVARDVYHDDGAAILDALSRTPRFNRWMADTIRPYLGEQVMEIGSGTGNLTAQLSPRRKQYLATDISSMYLSTLRVRFHNRPNIDFRKCNLVDPSDFESLQSRFDTVVCLNVLEHVEDHKTALRNIVSALRPGGRAIVLVPQGPGIYGTLDVVLEHFRRYTEEQLKSDIETAGLVCERLLRFNRVTRPGWVLNGKILRKTRFGRFQLFCFDRFVWLWRIIDPWLPWNPVSIIAIGVKP